MAKSMTSAEVSQPPARDYEDVRAGIVSGDLLLASGDYLVSKAVQKITDSPWSHLGILFRGPDIARVLLLERVEDAGVRLAPVSKYLNDYKDGAPYDGMIVLPRITAAAPQRTTKVAAFGCDQLTLPSDKQEIAYIMARLTPKLTKQPTQRGYICCELVGACSKAGGYTSKGYDNFVTPQDVWCDSSVEFLARGY